MNKGELIVELKNLGFMECDRFSMNPSIQSIENYDNVFKFAVTDRYISFYWFENYYRFIFVFKGILDQSTSELWGFYNKEWLRCISFDIASEILLNHP